MNTNTHQNDVQTRLFQSLLNKKILGPLHKLSNRLGWNQHEVISKAIEIMWENVEPHEKMHVPHDKDAR